VKNLPEFPTERIPVGLDGARPLTVADIEEAPFAESVSIKWIGLPIKLGGTTERL